MCVCTHIIVWEVHLYGVRWFGLHPSGLPGLWAVEECLMPIQVETIEGWSESTTVGQP